MMTLTVRFLFLLFILYSISFVPLSADENPEINLWPAGAVPDEPEGIEKRKKPTTIDKVGKMRIAYVDEPSITVYKAPKDRSNGTSVIIFPGGGYNILAWTHEGTEIAEWLNSLGVSAFVLKYRVPRRDPEKPHTLPLQDAQRAIRIVRSRSKEWGIDPARIGALGFSAGGHLAIMSGTHYGDKTYERVDDVDDLSSRPDFLIPIYPAYLGDRKNRDQLSGLVDINKNTPPMFIAITHDDSDRAYYSALLYAALKKSGVVGELHIYSKGGHGYGMRKSKDPVHTWPDRCADWLGSMGLLGP